MAVRTDPEELDVHSPANVQAEFPQLRALDEYDDLLEAITAQLT